MSDMNNEVQTPSGFVSYHDMKVLVHQMMAEMSEAITERTINKIEDGVDPNQLVSVEALRDFVKVYVDEMNNELTSLLETVSLKIDKIQNLTNLVDIVEEKLANLPTTITPIPDDHIISLFQKE